MTEPTDVLTQVAIIQTDSVSIVYCVYQLKAERAASLNYNNKESYGENIYIKPCFISSVIAGPHATAAGQISGAVPQLLFSISLLEARARLNIVMHGPHARHVQTLILIMLRSSRLRQIIHIARHIINPPQSSGHFLWTQCTGLRSICINIHLLTGCALSVS